MLGVGFSYGTHLKVEDEKPVLLIFEYIYIHMNIPIYVHIDKEGTLILSKN